MSNNAIYSGVYTIAVTPADGTDLPGGLCRAFNVGVTGNVKVTFENGSTDTLVGLVAGVVQPYQVKRIWSTGTTATSISAIY